MSLPRRTPSPSSQKRSRTTELHTAMGTLTAKLEVYEKREAMQRKEMGTERTQLSRHKTDEALIMRAIFSLCSMHRRPSDEIKALKERCKALQESIEALETRYTDLDRRHTDTQQKLGRTRLELQHLAQAGSIISGKRQKLAGDHRDV